MENANVYRLKFTDCEWFYSKQLLNKFFNLFKNVENDCGVSQDAIELPFSKGDFDILLIKLEKWHKSYSVGIGRELANNNLINFLQYSYENKSEIMVRCKECRYIHEAAHAGHLNCLKYFYNYYTNKDKKYKFDNSIFRIILNNDYVECLEYIREKSKWNAVCEHDVPFHNSKCIAHLRTVSFPCKYCRIIFSNEKMLNSHLKVSFYCCDKRELKVDGSCGFCGSKYYSRDGFNIVRQCNC